MASPVPIVLCGAKVALGMTSAKFMAPEYEVIHFCASVDEAVEELPRILAGEPVNAAEVNDVGTHNYSLRPKAIMVGRTYTDDKLDRVRTACEGKGEVSWVVPGEPAAKNEVIGPDHATKVATNMKNTLNELVSSGTMGKEGLFKYAF